MILEGNILHRVEYSGPSPFGHFYSRDTSIHRTQNLVQEITGIFIIFISVTSIEGTRPLLRKKGHTFSGFQTQVYMCLHSRDTSAVQM